VNGKVWTKTNADQISFSGAILEESMLIAYAGWTPNGEELISTPTQQGVNSTEVFVVFGLPFRRRGLGGG